MDDSIEDYLIEALQTKYNDETSVGYKNRLDKIRELLLANSAPIDAGAFLLIIHQKEKPYWYKLVKDQTIIGREKYADLVLEHPWISNKHCEVSYDNSDWLIKDLNSKNGVIINGKEKPFHFLNEGDAVEIGNYLLIFITV